MWILSTCIYYSFLSVLLPGISICDIWSSVWYVSPVEQFRGHLFTEAILCSIQQQNLSSICNVVPLVFILPGSRPFGNWTIYKGCKKNIVNAIKFKLYSSLSLVKVYVICKRCISSNWFNKRVLRSIKHLEC